jgi:thiamine kinase-like enzyme
MNEPVPTDFEWVWVDGPTVTAALEVGLSESLGRPVRVAEMLRRPVELSSHPVERLRVRLDDGARLKVVFKRLTDDVRPENRGYPREVLVYRHLLASGRFGAPKVYASVFDKDRGQFWLFLEDVGYDNMKHSDREGWDAAARLLAELHGTYLGRTAELRRLNCLAEHDGDYYRSIAGAARRNMVLAGDTQTLARFDALLRPFENLVDDLTRQPRTFVHGDVFSKNLALQEGPRVRPIDWESAGIGTPFLDVARLLNGWGSDKPSFVTTYLDELECRAAVPVDRPASLRAFTECEIVSILWDLGWSVDGCLDEASVNELLNDMEALWTRLREGRPDD